MIHRSLVRNGPQPQWFQFLHVSILVGLICGFQRFTGASWGFHDIISSGLCFFEGICLLHVGLAPAKPQMVKNFVGPLVAHPQHCIPIVSPWNPHEMPKTWPEAWGFPFLVRKAWRKPWSVSRNPLHPARRPLRSHLGIDWGLVVGNDGWIRIDWAENIRCLFWYIPGWWFQTFFLFHNIWDNPSHWLAYVSRCFFHHQPDPIPAMKFTLVSGVRRSVHWFCRLGC